MVITLTVGDDVMDDARGDVRWLTYDELAALRGISRDSATRLAMRRHWPRRAGNDGKARVAVPADTASPPDMSPPDVRPVITPDIAHDDTPDVRVMTGDIMSSLPELVAVLHAQLADVIRQRDASDARTEAAEARAAKLLDVVLSREGQGAALMAKVDAAERRADKAEALLSGELAQLRVIVAALSAKHEGQAQAADLAPGTDFRRTRRPQRRGLLARLFG